MRSRKHLVAIVVVFLLSACAAPYHWVKEGVTPEQRNRDQAECRLEALKATAGYSRGPQGVYNVYAGDLYGAISYGAAAGAAGADKAIREKEIENLCLEAKGYRREPTK